MSNFNVAIYLMVISIAVSFAVIATLLYCYTHKKSLPQYFYISLILIASGALGNGIDRLYNYCSSGFKISYAYVIDFISYMGFFTGNLADVYLVVGCCIMIFYLLKEQKAFERKI